MLKQRGHSPSRSQDGRWRGCSPGSRRGRRGPCWRGRFRLLATCQPSRGRSSGGGRKISERMRGRADGGDEEAAGDGGRGAQGLQACRGSISGPGGSAVGTPQTVVNGPSSHAVSNCPRQRHPGEHQHEWNSWHLSTAAARHSSNTVMRRGGILVECSATNVENSVCHDGTKIEEQICAVKRPLEMPAALP